MDNIIAVTRAVLQTTPRHWQHLTQSLPAALLTTPAAPGEWSALECLQHLVDTERAVFPVRVQALLAGQDFPAYDPDSQGTRPEAGDNPAALAAEFARRRTESLELLNRLSETDLTRQVRHQELGLVTLSELLHEWAGHDLMHTVQAERAMMQPFIQGCGPWQLYFKDHVITGR
ncbi:MAG: DinB family protein [Anaerolineae bacterium]